MIRLEEDTEKQTIEQGHVIPNASRRTKITHYAKEAVVGVTLFLAVRLLTLYASVALSESEQFSHNEIDWVPCAANKSYSCGYLEVPKDYLNPSAGSAHIAMLRVPATAKESQRLGTIFVNPGGPGGSGVTLALRAGQHLSDLLDGRYDILGFDPRGIGSTRPRVECFASTRDYQEFKAGTVLERGFDVPANPGSQEGRLHLLEQHRQLLALQQAEFEKCADTMGDELRYMGTSTVVRDIERMSAVIEGPEARINYWGGSYGTILGAFLVNILPPHKIGRVVVDGVASSPQWVGKHSPDWLHDWIENTEETFTWFLRDCYRAGPKTCPLAQESDKGPEDIGKRLVTYVDQLFESPIAVPDAIRPGILNAGAGRTLLYGVTQQPRSWPAASRAFAEALDGNPSLLYNSIIPAFAPGAEQTDLSRAAVTCADSPSYAKRQDWPTAQLMVNKTLYNLKASPRFGASVHIIEPDGGCQFHPASGRAPERFTGPFNASLDHPMLIISNTADPITPLASGRELNHLMGSSSRLLIQNSPGHCSIGSVSACTSGYFSRYFLHGELPKDETLCEVDEGYFPGAAVNSSDKSPEDLRRMKIGKQVADVWGSYATPFDYAGDGSTGQGFRFI